MFKTSLKMAVRSLRRYRTRSFINISGLAVGMAVAMLIGLWIWDEWSFDTWHENYHSIAQVMEKDTYNGTVSVRRSIPLPLGDELRNSYGDNFRAVALSSSMKNHILSVGGNDMDVNKKISYPGIFIDSEGPQMLTLKMVSGGRDALKDRSAVLISASVAAGLFGREDAVGKLMTIDDTASFRVAGVYADLPENTTLHEVAFMAPWEYYQHSAQWIRESATNWHQPAFQLFVQTAPNASMAAISERIKDAKLNHITDNAKVHPQIFLQPMRNWHLYSEFKNGVITGGGIQYVRLFGIIGLFVLLLACINFMNLSTASSEKKAKEVGVRKAAGSLRWQLVSQFFCESVFMALLAFVFSLLLVWMVLPLFNDLAGKQMTMPWVNPFFWMVSLGFAIFTGLIAGTYPALYLSSFNPVKVLKGTFRAGRAAAIPRQALVVLQFTVSIVLAICTIIVFQQIRFAKDRPVEYSRNGLVNIDMVTPEIRNHFAALREDLLRSGMVSEVAQSSSPVTAVQNDRDDISWPGKDPAIAVDFAAIRVTSEYGKTVDWKLSAGRDFSARMLTDSQAVILNETAVKYMGLKDPIGKQITMSKNPLTIIGVVKDMVMASPYDPVKQTIYFIVPNGFDDMIVRINPQAGVHEAVDKIVGICKRYSSAAPVSYKFADEEYDRKFASEARVGKLSGVFALLAVFVSCLGLFGMATFTTEQRTKEIGIRKVLGASVTRLWALLSGSFVLLVGISLLVAVPLAYYFMTTWLDHYAYRTAVAWWVFAAVAAGAITVTLLTVSYACIRAALMNPTKSLRTE